VNRKISNIYNPQLVLTQLKNEVDKEQIHGNYPYKNSYFPSEAKTQTQTVIFVLQDGRAKSVPGGILLL
jgi:hypothetical protein